MTHWQIIALCGAVYFGITWLIVIRQVTADARAEQREAERQGAAERFHAALDPEHDWPVRSMNVGAASDFHNRSTSNDRA